jgi:apolipoprotein N-acyltransferase
VVVTESSVAAGVPPAQLRLRALVAVLSAAWLILVSTPIGWHWLHWIAYVPMFWVVREGEDKRNLWLAWLYGTAAVGVLFSWVADTIILFSNIPTAGAYGILVLFAAVFGSPYVPLWASVHPLRKRLGDGWILAFPALAVLIEWVSQFVLLFPYNAGAAQYRSLQVFQLASITGVWGVTYLIFLVNAAFGEAVIRWREGRPFPARTVSAVAIAWSLVVIYGAWRFERVEATLREAPTVRVAQLQTEMTMVERINTSARRTFQTWVDKTAAVPPDGADLVVWPEGASPYSLQQEKVAKMFGELARRGGFEMIVGGGAREKTPGTGESTGTISFNSVYMIDHEGNVTQRYDKQVPLPFGEYMPLAEGPLGFLVSWIEGPGHFRAGDSAVVLEGQDFRFATPICYEAILSTTCRLFERPDVFVTVTNDAWFGDTAAPWQHAMLAAVRATELGVPMYRSAYTGVSMAVEPHGVIHGETHPFTEVDRIVTLRVAQFPTFYARFGDWFVLLCALGVAASLWRSRG